jgi:hypothetical protein
MSRSSSRAKARAHRQLERLLLSSAMALVLTALPVGLSSEGPLLTWQAASAKDGSNGHGLGRGAGRGAHGPGQRGSDSQGQAYWYGRGHADQGGGVNDYHDLDEFLDNVRSGEAFGLAQRDERIAAAAERYHEALGNRASHTGHDLGSDQIGPVAHQFSPEETQALLERGWQGRLARTDGFRNQGERVRTMVELSKRLGYGARVGALQANFGTPFENGIADLEAQLDAAKAAGDDQAEVESLEAKLADAIRQAKPGQGPDDSWATVDLDVNDDGVVDQHDLEALEPTDSADGTDGAPPTG